jgi:hypothetical protein
VVCSSSENEPSPSVENFWNNKPIAPTATKTNKPTAKKVATRTGQIGSPSRRAKPSELSANCRNSWQTRRNPLSGKRSPMRASNLSIVSRICSARSWLKLPVSKAKIFFGKNQSGKVIGKMWHFCPPKIRLARLSIAQLFPFSISPLTVRFIHSLFFVFAAAACLRAQHDSVRVFLHVEQMPFFAGCEQLKNSDPAKRACSDLALATFIAENLQCPDSPAVASGTFVVSFVIDENGAASQDTVLRDLPVKCGPQVRTVLQKMPRWEPGQHGGKPVKVRLTLPVRVARPLEIKPDETENYSIHWGKLRGDKVSKNTLLQCLQEQLYIRDDFGNAVYVSELVFIFEKKRRTSEARVSGNLLDKKMKKLVQKISGSGTFTISATVPREGRFLVVEKSFEVED